MGPKRPSDIDNTNTNTNTNTEEEEKERCKLDHRTLIGNVLSEMKTTNINVSFYYLCSTEGETPE